jgi:hypothetical protein
VPGYNARKSEIFINSLAGLGMIGSGPVGPIGCLSQESNVVVKKKKQTGSKEIFNRIDIGKR